MHVAGTEDRDKREGARGTTRSTVLKVCLCLFAGLVLATAVLLILRLAATWSVREFERDLRRSTDPSYAFANASSLADLGDKGVPALVAALEDEKAVVRLAAVRTLARFKNSRSTPEIAQAILRMAAGESQANVRADAGWTLYALGYQEESFPFVMSILAVHPNDLGYTSRGRFVSTFRIREGVTKLMAELKNAEGYDEQAEVLRNLCVVVGNEIEAMPGLKSWELTEGKPSAEMKAMIVREMEMWWKRHASEYRRLDDVLGGKAPIVPPKVKGPTDAEQEE